MSQMTPIQRDALAMAQRGDWRLADAMELLHRKENDPEFKGLLLSHGVLECGRMRALVYSHSTECSECDGDGVIYGYECHECDGSGLMFGEGAEDDIATDLNGHETEITFRAKPLSFPTARQLIDLYNAGCLPEAPNPEQKELPKCA
jgi:hypothetical protein